MNKYLKSRRLIVIFFITHSFFYNCINTENYSTEKSAWKIAIRNNTIYEYSNFLVKFPQSEYSQKANQLIDSLEFENSKIANTLYSYKNFLKRDPTSKYKDSIFKYVQLLQHNWKEDFKDVKSIFINVDNKSLPKGFNFYNDSIELVSLFKDAFIGISREKENADLILSIRLSGHPISAMYEYDGYKHPLKSYSGAVLSGFLTLQKKNKILFNSTIEGRYAPPDKIPIDRIIRSAENAPYAGAFQESGIIERLELKLNEFTNYPLRTRLKIFDNTYLEPNNIVAISDNTIYVERDNGSFINVVNSQNGKLIKDFFYLGALRLSNEVIYGISKKGELSIIDVKTTNLLKKITLPEDCRFNKKSGKFLILESKSKKLIYVVDEKTGSIKWKFVTTRPECLIIKDELLYSWSLKGVITAYNINDGSEEWKFKVKDFEDYGFTVVGEYVYVYREGLLKNNNDFIINTSNNQVTFMNDPNNVSFKCAIHDNKFLLFEKETLSISEVISGNKIVDINIGETNFNCKKAWIIDDMIYLQSDKILAYDKNKKTWKWKFSENNLPQFNTFVLGKERICFFSENSIYSINSEDGTLIWKRYIDKKNSTFKTFEYQNTIFYASDEALFAIDSDYGHIKWKFLIENNNIKYDISEFVKGIFYLYSNDCLYVLNSETGIIMSEFSFEGKISRIIFNKNDIYIGLNKGGIVIIESFF